jgi:MoaA/NifB/PqqE/SkfB family radical SAM enzyme
MTNFYCAAIHHNVRIEGNTVSGIKILPCCVYKTPNRYPTLEEYYASQELQNLQKATEWPDGCVRCNNQEKQNQTSLRNHCNNQWPDTTKEYGTRFELFPSNVCNLKCLMCSPDFSTALAQERHAIGNIDSNYIKEFNISDDCIDMIKSADKIESISVIGGEFFLTKGNLKIMDFVIEKNIPFRVVTNGTVILAQHIEKLKKISKLELQISVDGIETSYEFMRYPAKWKTFESNVNTLLTELQPDRINFHFVVQTLNVQTLIPTLDYLNKYKIKTRITNLIEPIRLSWTILNNQEKRSIVELLTQQITQYGITPTQKKFVIDLGQTIMNTPHNSQLRDKFIMDLRQIVKHRKLSIGLVKKQLGILAELEKLLT